MTQPRRLVVLRPEPGSTATRDRIAAAGGMALALPLFAVRPLDWSAPDPGDFDALVLTSANAIRFGGPALSHYRALPVFAVGRATADAARAAGLSVAATGSGDATALAAHLRGHDVARALHLSGRDRTSVALPGVVATIAVYASEPLTPSKTELAALTGSVVLVHSARAAARLAELAGDRAAVRIAALSEQVRAAAGPGWAAIATAARPDDDALIAAALDLARTAADSPPD